MEQTPAHEQHNPDLLKFIPKNAIKLIEVGCSSGALAKAFKTLSSNNHYVGVEVDPRYTDLAKRFCDDCLTLDIENADSDFWNKYSDRDCWIFGDTLEHLKDPWKILRKIRDVLPDSGCLVMCVPNAQHWSLQVRLSIGDFRYQDSGLLDRTHLRWFTRQTIIEMLDKADFKIDAGTPRIFNEPSREVFLPIIEKMALLAGGDQKIAIQDALPLQYVIRAIPK